MADISSTKYTAQVAGTTPVKRPSPGAVGVEYATCEVGSAQSSSDVLNFFYLPSDSLVVGGYLIGDDLDTGTEALEIDVGTAADPDALINSGVLTGDAHGIGAMANVRLFDGLLTTAGNVDLGGAIGGKTAIIGTVIAAANAGGTGTLTLRTYFEVP